jgi:hypothetical protein
MVGGHREIRSTYKILVENIDIWDDKMKMDFKGIGYGLDSTG